MRAACQPQILSAKKRPIILPASVEKKRQGQGPSPQYFLSSLRFVALSASPNTSPAASLWVASQFSPLTCAAGLFASQKQAVTRAIRKLACASDQADQTAVAHGFRSSFRNWAGEESGASHEVIEWAMAHVVGNVAEQAYSRSDLLDQRRELMQA